MHNYKRKPSLICIIAASHVIAFTSLLKNGVKEGCSSASFDEGGFTGLTPGKKGKLLSRFLFQWIHQNGRQLLFLFTVHDSLLLLTIPVHCSLVSYTFPYIVDPEL
jgi:hypothetical protein